MKSNQDAVAERTTGDGVSDRAADGHEPGAEPWSDTRLLDAVDDIVCIFSPEGKLRRWNGRVVDITGYSPSELAGMTVRDLSHADDHSRVARSLETAVQTGTDRMEIDIQTKDGTRIPYEFCSRRLPDSAGRSGAISVGRDISERRERERQLARQNERLDQFAEMVAHDIRNPLNIIDAHRELASQELGGESDHLDKIEAATSRIERITDDVLWLAREGQTIGTTSSVALDQIVDDAWAMVAADAPRAELRYTAGTRTFDADDDRVRQLFENLFRNAVEHAGPDVTLTVGTTANGFFVEDDGPGIPEAERERVFDSGYTTNDGTGLGLSVVAEVADAHGWEVAAAEGTDGGARFEFEIDADPTPDSDESLKSTIDNVWSDLSDGDGVL